MKRITHIVAVILFVIPFLWFRSGEMDLGGDGNRLYFYDPINFIKATSLYDISTFGKGIYEPAYIMLPYVSAIAALKLFMNSTAVISLVNAIKLSVSFLSIAGIVRLLLSERTFKQKDSLIEFAAISAGLMYVAAFGSVNMSFFWERALITHNQMFLNPLMFYMLLQFFHTTSNVYVWAAIAISFVFSPNFGPIAGPPFFAFYPLSILCLLIYQRFIRKQAIPWKKLSLGLLLFLGVQAFHLVGELVGLMDTTSTINTIVFDREFKIKSGLNYFLAIAGNGKVIMNLLLPSKESVLGPISVLAPLMVLAGLFLGKPLRKKLLLIAGCFMTTLYFTTANITAVGFAFYKMLFVLPGFSMFRNFYTQWLYVHLFYYAILFGMSTALLLRRLRPKYVLIIMAIVTMYNVASIAPTLMGKPVTKPVIWGSDNNLSVVTTMDPRYEEVMDYIRRMSEDGKFLVLPLTSYFRQLVAGTQGGTYEGPSTLMHLTDKYSFTGYQHLYPYPEEIMEYSRLKNYDALLRIFSTLNIRYILYNSDPNILDGSFSTGGPYAYMSTKMPKTQREYEEFIRNFPLHLLYQNGPYLLYELDEAVTNPTIFVPTGVYKSSRMSFEKRPFTFVFVDPHYCNKEQFLKLCDDRYARPEVSITVRKVNPTRYEITVIPRKRIDSLFLVMQHAFHTGWVLRDGERVLAKDAHIQVNGYGNGWVVSGNELPQKTTYSLMLEFDPQKYFWYGWIVSGISLIFMGYLIFKDLQRRYRYD